MSNADVYVMNVSDMSPRVETYYSFLSRERIDKTHKYILDSAKRQSMGVELLLNYAVKLKSPHVTVPISYSYDKRGKPYMPTKNAMFSLAHSGNIAVCALSDSDIGIDVEIAKKVNGALGKHILSNIETMEFHTIANDSTYIVRRWVDKEAYLKLTGEGLRLSMQRFTVLGNDVIDLNGHTLAYVNQRVIPAMQCFISVATKDVCKVTFTVVNLKTVIECLR